MRSNWEIDVADDLNRRQPEDPLRINLREPWEVRYWTDRLGVSEAKLKQAVAAVGVMVSNVREWLSKN